MDCLLKIVYGNDCILQNMDKLFLNNYNRLLHQEYYSDINYSQLIPKELITI